jgi:hypothetical protein
MNDLEDYPMEEEDFEEDENTPSPILNFTCAISCFVPMYFLDDMVVDGFTYELPGNRKFRGKHLLDKALYADYMMMRSKFYQKNHCVVDISSDWETSYTIFILYFKGKGFYEGGVINKKDFKENKFRFKAIRMKCGPNPRVCTLNNIQSMRELSRKEAKAYDSYIQERLSPTDGFDTLGGVLDFRKKKPVQR